MFEVCEKEAGDFPASDLTDNLPLVCNVSDDILHDQMNRAVAAGYPLIEATAPHERVAVIVGSGPSAEDDIAKIEDAARNGWDIFALNGACLWLQERGICPHGIVVLDARPHNARFVAAAREEVVCYIATQCHKETFDAVANRKIVAWHPAWGGEYPGVMEHRPTVLIGGGSSVGLRALRIVHVLGYRTVHLFGYDSSYADGASHAFDQPENSIDRPLGAQVGGRWFVSTPWMIRQADDFQRIAASLVYEGVNIHVHGDGLLPEIARQMGRVE